MFTKLSPTNKKISTAQWVSPKTSTRVSITLKLLLTSSILLVGCYRVPDKIDPQVNTAVQDKYIKMLPASFPPLSFQELQQEWGREYTIGLAFAEKLDLYRAVTAFKRAEILMPSTETIRKQQAQYYILLSYYLGHRYQDVIETLNDSDLSLVTSSFQTYNDLLVILYESYLEIGEKERAQYYYQLIQERDDDTAEKLHLSTALIKGDLITLKEEKANEPDISALITYYEKNRKSVGLAQGLNALLPGAGYLYVGQKQSAFTALLLNGLFIGATYAFFHNGYTAAGAITASFEAGWYFGGIYGAGHAAKLYNERLYEKVAFDTLQNRDLFPIFMLKYAF